MAKSDITNKLLGDRVRSVQYMSTKVTMEFPPRRANIGPLITNIVCPMLDTVTMDMDTEMGDTALVDAMGAGVATEEDTEAEG